MRASELGYRTIGEGGVFGKDESGRRQSESVVKLVRRSGPQSGGSKSARLRVCRGRFSGGDA